VARIPRRRLVLILPTTRPVLLPRTRGIRPGLRTIRGRVPLPLLPRRLLILILPTRRIHRSESVSFS